MLIKHLKILKFICTQSHILGMHYFKWESATNRLKNLGRGKSVYSNQLMFTYLFILSFQGCSLFYKDIDFKEQVSYFISFFIGSSIFAYKLSVQFHSLSICTCINSLLDFDTNIRLNHSLFPSSRKKPKQSLLETVSVLAAYGFLAFSISVPFLLHFGIHWQNPCYISLTGYWIIPKCYMRGTKHQLLPYWFAAIDQVIHAVVMGINYWYWTFGFTAALYTSVLMILCTLSLVENLKL